MDEKILIKSERYNVKKMFLVFLVIGLVLSTAVFMFFYTEAADYHKNSYARDYEVYTEHQAEGTCGRVYSYFYGGYIDEDECFKCEWIRENPNTAEYALDRTFDPPLFLSPIAFFAMVGGVLFLWLRSYELTVTDKRIYGTVAWGKRVDLPNDSVSATSTIRLTKGVSVSTASGRISFRVIKNAEEVYSVINKLLIERQENKKKEVYVAAPASVAQPASQPSVTDELRKFKELLDDGIITQEEFDAKKKQLLGL